MTQAPKPKSNPFQKQGTMDNKTTLKSNDIFNDLGAKKRQNPFA
jgi:hypothetical protein